MKLALMIAAQVLTITAFVIGSDHPTDLDLGILEYIGMSVISFALIYFVYNSYRALSKFSS